MKEPWLKVLGYPDGRWQFPDQDYLVVLMEKTAVFPDVKGVPVRKSFTGLIFELPPEPSNPEPSNPETANPDRGKTER